MGTLKNKLKQMWGLNDLKFFYIKFQDKSSLAKVFKKFN